MKDEDMHNFGGECQAFREEDKKKKEDEERKAKQKADEERKKQDKIKKQRDEIFQQNFGIVDEDDDWAVSDPPSSGSQRAGGASKMPNVP